MGLVIGIVIAVALAALVGWAFMRGVSQAPGTSGTPSRHYKPELDEDQP